MTPRMFVPACMSLNVEMPHCWADGRTVEVHPEGRGALDPEPQVSE